MIEKEQRRFDRWWYDKKNRLKLMEIYYTTQDANVAVMELVEIAWEGATKKNKGR